MGMDREGLSGLLGHPLGTEAKEGNEQPTRFPKSMGRPKSHLHILFEKFCHHAFLQCFSYFPPNVGVYYCFLHIYYCSPIFNKFPAGL